MKKIVIALATLALAAGVASAQDLNAALEVYNNALAQSENDKAAALAGFEEALKMGAALGEEGADLVANCKTVIPTLNLSLAKAKINESDFDAALEMLTKTEAIASEYENGDVLLEIPDLYVTVYNRRGSKLFNDKNFEAALADFAKVVEADEKDGQTWLKIAMAQQGLGKMDEAIEAYKTAAANGKEAAANKRLGSIYIAQAQAAQKAGKIADALELYKTAMEYVENAGVYKVMGNLYAKTGKHTNANEAYKKYLELKPNAPDADDVKYTIAASAQKIGDKAMAREYYNQLLSSAKYAETAKQQLATIK